MTELASPYARTLGLTRGELNGRTVLTLPESDGMMGRPGFLHGGAIAGLLENAAWVTLADALPPGASIKPVSITIDFMRGGRMVATFARADLVRVGRRIANVTAIAWQDDITKPIASANLKLLIG